MGLFNRIKEGLKKTRSGIMGRLDGLFRRSVFDDDFFEELEEILIGADMGVNTTLELTESLRDRLKAEKAREPEQVMDILKQLVLDTLGRETPDIAESPESPTVILVLGVNGVGKTTTIGKLAHRYQQNGKRVLLAAGDTFRAAASEQLETWARRAQADLIKHQHGADPAAVLFDAVSAARARSADVVICDTAGRLHNKANLMEELKKLHRVLDKALPGAPHEVLLVLDATTGQNALAQAQVFNEAAPLTGVVLTKLDGTAKGGIVVAIARELKVPVKFVGIGEGIDDLQPFVPEEYVDALFAGNQP